MIFFHGLHSDMEGDKAKALQSWCRQRDMSYLRFDYRGHGQSGARFEESCVSDWLRDGIDMLDLVQGRQILVGSSIGGWIMLLVALARKKRVAGLLGIASAADATEKLILPTLSARQREEMRTQGMTTLRSEEDPDFAYPISQKLIEDARRHLLLENPIPLDCPAIFIHGMKDASVDWQISLDIMDKMRSQHCRALLIKNGDHRLSDVHALGIIEESLDSLVRQIANEAAQAARGKP